MIPLWYRLARLTAPTLDDSIVVSVGLLSVSTMDDSSLKSDSLLSVQTLDDSSLASVDSLTAPIVYDSTVALVVPLSVPPVDVSSMASVGLLSVPIPDDSYFASVTKSLVVSLAAIPSSDIDMMTLADVLNSVFAYFSRFIDFTTILYHHDLHSNLFAPMG